MSGAGFVRLRWVDLLEALSVDVGSKLVTAALDIP
jgi:hypothetical protein